jgi:hypothetical protein
VPDGTVPAVASLKHVDSSGPSRPRRVFVHVGAPKTGTTYLQQVLDANADELSRVGGIVVADRMYGQHHAALDLRGIAPARGEDPRRAGSWDRLAARVTESGRDAVISSELLAWAAEEDVAHARETLSAFQMHVVFTMRDLGRQVPALWQEEIKNNASFSYDTFLERLADPERPRGPRDVWVGQDPRLALRWWADRLPPDRVHVVTVPPPDSDPRLLWRRFAAVLGIDPDAYPAVPEEANPSLGASQATLLQRVNAALPPGFRQPAFLRFVKHGLVETSLTVAGKDAQVAVPPAYLDLIRDRTEQIRAHIFERGWHVVGDLADLTPVETGPHPGPRPELMVDAAVEVIAGLLRRLAAEASPAVTVSGRPEVTDDPSRPNGGAPSPPVVREVWDRRHHPVRPGAHAVFIHVGTPTSGIDRMHALLWRQARVLGRHGIRLPGRNVLDHYFAALELRERGDVDPAYRQHVGTWPALAGIVGSRPGSWLLCHEQFAPLRARQAARAVEDLAPATVHLVVTVPNLDDQLPQAWIRHLLYARGIESYQDFVDGVVRNAGQGRDESFFWQTEDPMLLARPWRDVVPAERIHVITVPPAGPDRSRTLWRRYTAVLGLDADVVDPGELVPWQLSVSAAAVLRQLNDTGSVRDLPADAYEMAVRRRLGAVLAAQPGPQLRVPATHLSWRAKESARAARRLTGSGVDLLGSTDELTWVDSAAPRPDPDGLPGSVVATAEAETFGGFLTAIHSDGLLERSLPQKVVGRVRRSLRR